MRRLGVLLLQHSQCAEQHTNGVPPANRVLRPGEIVGEEDMCLVCGRRRECDEFHRLVVERRDRLMNGESGKVVR